MPQSFPVKIPDFQLNAEHTQVYVKNMEIDTLYGLGPEELNAMIPYTRLKHDLQASGYIGTKDIVGMVYGTFKVEGDEPIMAFELEAHIRARHKLKTQPADTANIAMQYLYDWLNDWVKENKIVDTNGQPVRLPRYSYSRYHFEKAFPDEDWDQ